MKINIKATGIELTAAISDYVQRRILSTEKYLHASHSSQEGFESDEGGIVAQVEVGKSTSHHKGGNIFRAEVHITGNGLDVYAVSEQDDLYAAVDLVKDEIVRSMVQKKEKNQTITRRSAEMMKYVMKGLAGGTVRGFSWGVRKLKFKGFGSFKKRP